uniref:DUF4159 domain-containing protein n=1 Tax=Steinernema glaseri TaxID=37863 RepID=A0A1I8ARM5_9BILA
MALLGVRPVWASGSQRVDDFEILPNAIDGRLWHSREDLAEVYLNHGAYAYGASDDGTAAREPFARRLSQVQAVLQNQDNHEHDLLDSN